MSVAQTLRNSTYLLDFLYSLQFGLVLYFNSSFLSSSGFSDREIGFAFALSYALAVILSLLAPRILTRFGNRRSFIGGALIVALLFMTLAAGAKILLVSAFILAVALSMVLYLSLDVFMETTSGDEGKTGGRRGLFNALKNGAFIAAQFLAGTLLVSGFGTLYLTAALLLLAAASAAHVFMRRFRDARYGLPRWRNVITRILRSSELQTAFYLQFLLRLFYSIMVIYTPLYLHGSLGIPLEELGIVFALMLAPFILLEVPIGRMEDRSGHERRVLFWGSLITASATALVSFVLSGSVLVWGAILFATRIGAVMLEIGSEAYFFRHVDGADSGLMSAFRMLYPLAYIFGPLAVSLLLSFCPMRWVFAALSITLLSGAVVASRARR